MLDFSVRLRQARKSRGLNQMQFAARLEVTQSCVSSWEVGRSEPDLLLLCRIAKVLDVSIDSLLDVQGSVLPEDLAEVLPELGKSVPGLLLDGEPISSGAVDVTVSMLSGTLEAARTAQKRFKGE